MKPIYRKESPREAQRREYREMMLANLKMAAWLILFTAILSALALSI